LDLKQPFDKREVRDSECLVYYQGKIERFFLFLYAATRGLAPVVLQPTEDQAVKNGPVPGLPKKKGTRNCPFCKAMILKTLQSVRFQVYFGNLFQEELYSVSKILGHRNLVSTQVYAKVNLEKKMEAVNLANGVFG
jgi:hypothetical protein